MKKAIALDGRRDQSMRTTLNIDDDVLAAAKLLAKEQKCSVGQVISELVRQELYDGGLDANKALAVAGGLGDDCS